MHLWLCWPSFFMFPLLWSPIFIPAYLPAVLTQEGVVLLVGLSSMLVFFPAVCFLGIHEVSRHLWLSFFLPIHHFLPGLHGLLCFQFHYKNYQLLSASQSLGKWNVWLFSVILLSLFTLPEQTWNSQNKCRQLHYKCPLHLSEWPLMFVVLGPAALT